MEPFARLRPKVAQGVADFSNDFWPPVTRMVSNKIATILLQIRSQVRAIPIPVV